LNASLPESIAWEDLVVNNPEYIEGNITYNCPENKAFKVGSEYETSKTLTCEAATSGNSGQFNGGGTISACDRKHT